jgi:hypothetical protein
MKGRGPSPRATNVPDQGEDAQQVSLWSMALDLLDLKALGDRITVRHPDSQTAAIRMDRMSLSVVRPQAAWIRHPGQIASSVFSLPRLPSNWRSASPRSPVSAIRADPALLRRAMVILAKQNSADGLVGVVVRELGQHGLAGGGDRVP